MIYLASPYSHPKPEIMERRFDAVCRVAGKLMNEGKVVYSPIVHCHPIAVRTGLPRDWAFWEKFDREMIQHAEAVYVVRLDGWADSKGVAAEVEIANELGILVVAIDP